MLEINIDEWFIATNMFHPGNMVPAVNPVKEVIAFKYFMCHE